MRHHVTNLCELLLTMLSFPTLPFAAHNMHGHALYRSCASDILMNVPFGLERCW